MTKNLLPGVVFQPSAQQTMQRGIHKLTSLISPTLGPVSRTVAHQKHNDIELLDKAALIARRMIELPNRHENVGAMYLRHMVWQLYEEHGDGTATAAVLFKTLYDEGLRSLTAGADAGKLRHYLEQALLVMLERLSSLTKPICTEAELQGIARSVCADEKLASLLGTQLSILGEFGKLELRNGGREHDWSFIEGNYWKGGVLSKRQLEGLPDARIELEDVGILATDFDLDDPRSLPPILKLALAKGFSKLVIVAKTASESVISFIKSPQLLAQIEVILVKQEGFSQAETSANQQDLCALLGGYPVVSLGAKTLPKVRSDDFGSARLVWADQHHAGFIGAKGDPVALASHVESLKTAFHASSDAKARKILRQRLNNLMGGAITLWLGGASKREMEQAKESAQQTEASLRSALEQGVIVGAGTAFLACRALLCAKAQDCLSFEEQQSYKILLKAIESPLRTMLENAGLEPAEVIEKLKYAKENTGFDIRTQTYVNVYVSGLLDVANVQKAALRYAVKSAALALTIEAVVFKKNPERRVNP